MNINKTLVACLSASVPTFENLNPSDQLAFAKLIVKSVTTSHWLYKDCFTVQTASKIMTLGSAMKFSRINSICQIFIPPYGNHYKFSGSLGFAKPWTLSPEAFQAIELFRLITLSEARGTITAEKFLSHVDQRNLETVRDYNNPAIDKLIKADNKRNPTAWIKSKTNDGNMSRTYKALKDAEMIRATPVDIEALSQLVEDISTMDFDQLRHKYPDIKLSNDDQEIAERKRILHASAATFALATALANNNTIPTAYTEAHNGRLIIEGMSLQNVPKVVRTACLKGQHSYDMSSCHWRLLHSIVQSNSYFNEMPETQKYINDKSGYRKAVADETGLPVSAVKQALIAIIFGGKCDMGVFNTFADIAQHDKKVQKKLVDALKPLADEVKETGRFIVKLYENNTPKHLKGIKNDAGKLMKFDTKPNQAQKLAFILQGLESELLRTVIKHNAKDILFLIHDGIVTDKEINLDAANAEIEELFKVKMVWDHEVIESAVQAETEKKDNKANLIVVKTSAIRSFQNTRVHCSNSGIDNQVRVSAKRLQHAYRRAQAHVGSAKCGENIGGTSCLR